MKKDSNFIYGKNPVLEAFNSKVTIEKVVIQNNLRGELEKEVRALCKTNDIPLVKVPLEKLDYLTYKQNHQGVAAYLSPIHFTQLEDVIAKAYEEGRNPSILILEGVSDVRNVGAIARSSYVFGIDAIVFPLKNSARINEDTVKISAGAILNLPVCREKNMETIINKCKSFGLKIIATDLRTDNEIEHPTLAEPCAIVLGSEERGITPETRKVADLLIKIPQNRDFDSLNVSVSAGIIAYEINRQKRLKLK